MSDRIKRDAIHTTQARLQALAVKVLFLMGRSRARLSLSLLPNREMVRMKRRFFKNFSPAQKKNGRYPYPQADVLAFPEKNDFPRSGGTGFSLGEVYVNGELYKNEPEHLAFLVIHGTLHLLGYRHLKRRDMIQMETLERRLWRQLCLSV